MPFVKADLEKEQRELERLMEDPDVARYARKLDQEFEFRRTIAQARLKSNLTQKDIQQLTGLTPQAISRIEADKTTSPNLDNIVRYLDAIGYKLTIEPKIDTKSL